MDWGRAGWALLAFSASSFLAFRVLHILSALLLLTGHLSMELLLAVGGLAFVGSLAAAAGASWLGARGVVWPFFVWLAISPLGFLIFALSMRALALHDLAAWLLAYASAGMYNAAMHVPTALYYAKAYRATGVEEMRKAGRRVVYGAIAAIAMPLLLPACALGDALALRTAVKKALGR
ncbi:MAG: hypothetical protein QXP98_01000 [Thermoproteus sp.]